MPRTRRANQRQSTTGRIKKMLTDMVLQDPTKPKADSSLFKKGDPKLLIGIQQGTLMEKMAVALHKQLDSSDPEENRNGLSNLVKMLPYIVSKEGFEKPPIHLNQQNNYLGMDGKNSFTLTFEKFQSDRAEKKDKLKEIESDESIRKRSSIVVESEPVEE